MQTSKLDAQDLELVEAAKEVIRRRFVLGKHHIGAAVRTKSGQIYTAVHLEAYISRITVCAEAMVLGKAISDGDADFDTIVAVRHPDPEEQDQSIRVVSPCGMCRELISDYGQHVNVILPMGEEIVKCNVMELLPYKYVRSMANE
jgi:cytidine deaminase